MKSESAISALLHSKLLLIGIGFLCLAVIFKVFAGHLPSIINSIYFSPFLFLATVAPYIVVPLIGSAVVWSFVRQAKSSKRGIVRLRFVLAVILAVLVAVSLHVLLVEVAGVKISTRDEFSFGDAGTLVIILLALAGPIAYGKLLVDYSKRCRAVNPTDTLSRENKLTVLFFVLLSVPLFALYYIFIIPIALVTIALLTTSY